MPRSIGAEQVVAVLASVEQSKEGKYTTRSQYLPSKSEDNTLVMRGLIDVLKKEPLLFSAVWFL
jgi:hypothetical protein